MIDNGLNAMTVGRVKRIQQYVGKERFLLTDGDGVTDLNRKPMNMLRDNTELNEMWDKGIAPWKVW